MSDESDTGFFRNLRGYANDWIETKRKRLVAKPQTKVDRSGGFSSTSFSTQDHAKEDLRRIKEIRESGGIISQAFDTKALIRFGTGVEFYAEEDALADELAREVWRQADYAELSTRIARQVAEELQR